jgi:ribonuclease HI
MKDFTGQINLQASMVGAKPPKSKSNLVPTKLWRQLHLTVVTGATVAGDRMKAQGKALSDLCPLDACRHTTDHLFWHCSAFAALRRPFTARIGKLMGLAICKGPAVQQYIAGVLDDVTFRNLGLVPEDDLAPEHAVKNWSRFALKPPVDATLLISANAGARMRTWAGRQYVMVYTDGSVKYSYHPWLAHGGWGIYVGPNAVANDYGMLEGPPFTSYRAELRGVVEACSRAVSPIWIICDNQAVSDQAAALFARLDATRMAHPHAQDLELKTPLDQKDPDEMWVALAGIVNTAPPKHFRITWMPGHLLDAGKEALLEDRTR